jgi:hypothetical protein
MYKEVKEVEDVYELIMEYNNCLDFYRQAVVDILDNKIEELFKDTDKEYKITVIN